MHGSCQSPCSSSARMRSVLEAVRHLAAVFLKLADDLLVEPDVHRGRPVLLANIAQLVRELLAGSEAAVEIKQLHQVDDGMLPIERHRVPGGHATQYSINIDRAGWKGRLGRGFCDLSSFSPFAKGMQDLAEDVAA